MQLFFSVDSYNHIPRNLFGFKKSGCPTEKRPVVSAIINSYGAIMHKGNFRNAKTKDDPSWDQKVVNPADYGHRKRDTELLADILSVYNQETVDAIIVFDSDIDVIDKMCWEQYKFLLSDWYKKCTTFYDYIDSWLNRLPDEYLMHLSNKGKFELTINMEEGEEYTAAQRSQLFHSHTACPVITASDSAMTRANKMFATVNLLRRIDSDFERFNPNT